MSDIDDGAPLPAKLRFAIANKRLIGVEYLGRLRIAEPHDFGAMSGTSKVLVYQLYADGAASGAAHGWRLLDLSKIGVCRVLDETFAGSGASSSM